MAIQLDVVEAPSRRLTVDETIRMAEVGIIGEAEHLELVDGRLVEMTPEGADHSDVTGELTTTLARLYPRGFRLRAQSTLPLGEHTDLEPDIYVVEAPTRRGEWPDQLQVVLVVEVSNASAARDRTEKARRYAAWGARVYWIVDLTTREVVIHTDPRSDGYANIQTVDEFGIFPIPGTSESLVIADIFPPRTSLRVEQSGV